MKFILNYKTLLQTIIGISGLLFVIFILTIFFSLLGKTIANFLTILFFLLFPIVIVFCMDINEFRKLSLKEKFLVLLDLLIISIFFFAIILIAKHIAFDIDLSKNIITFIKGI